MQYLGDDKYEIFIGDRFLTLTYTEIINFLQDTKNYVEKMECMNIEYFPSNEILNDLADAYKNKVEEYNSKYNKRVQENNNQKKIRKVQRREYNTNSKIRQLFKKYYDKSKTKKEVFIKISEELNISKKAVEKAYYRK